MDLARLLNSPEPEPPLVDISAQLASLATLLGPGNVILATPHVRVALINLVTRLVPVPTPPITPQPPPNILLDHPLAISVQHDVVVNQRMTVSELYKYPLGVSVEYPESSAQGVGHLFQIAPDDWSNPTLDFLYSKGEPRGHSKKGEEVTVPFLRDANGDLVPCKVKALKFALNMLLPLETSSRKRAFIAALRKQGCPAPHQEETYFDSDEEEEQLAKEEHQRKIRRGYVPSVVTCDGRLEFSHSFNGHPVIKCEHYSKTNNKDHYFNASINDGSFDVNYLTAVFEEDQEEIDYIENAAHALGFGPRVECTTVCNFSVQCTICPFDHRDSEGNLLQLEMNHLKCCVVFKRYEPLPEFRVACPYVLVVVKGLHPHPIPLPSKVPPKIRSELLELLPQFQEDLPDLTTRRLLRHPLLKSFLTKKLPNVLNPTLSDLHFSLANRSHVTSFIDQGTAWNGARYFFNQQTLQRPLADRYIRCMVELDPGELDVHPEDEPRSAKDPPTLRFILCMGFEGSERLLSCQYVQSDIGFKRVIGFYEFELAGWERDAKTYDYDGKLLQWAADQHGGQAKGLGLHLQQIAQQFPQKWDLHEANRLLALLSPYEHLHRSFRLCVTHIYRNIRKCKVEEAIRHLMRSLVCMEHPDWDATILKIRNEGGKAAQAMCWEKSFMPEDVWKAGDRTSNLIETAHADINREGVHCTLVGGILKGEFYDNFKMKTLKVFESSGIRPSYATGHPSENVLKNLKRKFSTYHKGLESEDHKIADANKKIQEAFEKFQKARQKIQARTQPFTTRRHTPPPKKEEPPRLTRQEPLWKRQKPSIPKRFLPLRTSWRAE
ncbi:hypothetical protein B0H17DRAFT_1184191 [Mycena rosella]|uniref:Uncharacterized protein n=1 Tax=Mycena rosella TaxID=1033263 RepID=A0AAD7D0J1_MYCRO|nr:hypothetical protein B0H17DRAFT_1184191 [Mycena rosella]